MRVKIVKCKSPDFWYVNMIGQEFKVTQCKFDSEDYTIIDDFMERSISKSDCEVVKEETYVKVGDIVECIDGWSSSSTLVVGKRYEVSELGLINTFILKDTKGSWVVPLEKYNTFKLVKEEHKFKIGDTVRVRGKIGDYEKSVDWVNAMNTTIGLIGEIEAITSEGSIRVRFDSINDCRYYCPESLELFKKEYQFKVGDTVRVIKKIETFRRWVWWLGMDDTLGKTYKIYEIEESDIAILETESGSWRYSFESLELVEEYKEKEQKTMVRNFNNFQVDHWYIYTGTERKIYWNNEGGMDFALTHIPLKCLKTVFGDRAMFQNRNGVVYEGAFGGLWDWECGFDNWIEIEDPNQSHYLNENDYLYNSEKNKITKERGGLILRPGEPFFALKRNKSTSYNDCLIEQKTPKFQVGDKVKIVKKVGEWKGNSWTSGMDYYISKIVTIRNVNNECKEFRIVEDTYSFPFECAEKVESPPFNLPNPRGIHLRGITGDPWIRDMWGSIGPIGVLTQFPIESLETLKEKNKFKLPKVLKVKITKRIKKNKFKI